MPYLKKLPPNQKAVKLYKIIGSIQKVGNLMGKSHEWVRIQINRAEVKPIHPYTHPKEPFCPICKRKYVKGKIRYSGGYCSNCYQYLHSKHKHNKIRTILYPKRCLRCKKKWKKGEVRANGYCKKCKYYAGPYSQWRKKYTKTQKWKNFQKAWVNRNYKKVREGQKKYYYKNKEGLLEYHTQYKIRQLLPKIITKGDLFQVRKKPKYD